MSRQFRPQNYSRYFWLVLFCVVIVMRYYGDGSLEPPPAGHPAPRGQPSLSPGEHRVVRAVDGDTLLIAPHERLRLIGVNAPETVKPDWPVEPWGPEASAFTKEFVSGGTVRLEFD